MRPDLLALTPEALALLSNLGLVKRAQKDIAAGNGPTVTEADGIVTGVFADGIETRLPPGTSLQNCQCSCGSTQLCRHRLATVLVYVAQPAAPQTESTLGEPDLQAFLGKRLYDKALRQRGRTRATPAAAPPLGETRANPQGQVVHLDTCTVHFLSGQRLEFARCDCAVSGPCEHIALAFWALQGETSLAPPTDLTALEPALELVKEVIAEGVSHLGQGLRARFVEARRGLERNAMVWPHTLLTEIEDQLAYYQKASGRYAARRLAYCATSLWARAQASRRDPQVCAAALGLKLAPETSLQKIRLTGLGCRKEKDETLFFLADSANHRVLVLAHPSGRSPSGLPARKLAAGELISAAAHRRANGMLRLGRGPHSLTECNDWSHLQHFNGLPPSSTDLLGDCHAAPEIRILQVEEVVGSCYSPGQQEVSLMIQTQEDMVRLTLAHRSAAPLALECLWEAREGLQAAAGPMDREGGVWRMQPTALMVNGQVRVPDLAESGSLEDADLDWAEVIRQDPLAVVLEEALSCWHDVVHRGLGAGQQKRRETVSRLRQVGLERTAAHLERAREAEEWLDLAARLEVALAEFSGQS